MKGTLALVTLGFAAQYGGAMNIDKPRLAQEVSKQLIGNSLTKELTQSLRESHVGSDV